MKIASLNTTYIAAFIQAIKSNVICAFLKNDKDLSSAEGKTLGTHKS